MLILFLTAQITYGLTLSSPISFVPGSAAASTSFLAASPNSVLADGTATTTLTFTARDAYNNLAPGTAVSLSVSGGNNTFGVTSGAANGNGVFKTTLASTSAQAEVVTVSFGSGLSVTAIVQFIPGAASSSTSSLVLSPNTQLANNSDTITALLTLRDAQGNPIPGVTPAFTASGSSTTIASPLATSSSGQTSVTYQTPVAQNENALVTAGGLSLNAPMMFVAGPPTSAASTLAASPRIVAGNGTAVMSLVTTARDAQGNLAAGASVSLAASGGNNTFGAAAGTTSSSGTYTTTLKSTLMQTETVTATIAGNVTETVSVTFTGDANVTTSSFVVNPNLQTVGPSNLMTATLTLKDAASNPLADVTPNWTASGGNNTITSAGATSSSGVGTATYASTLAQSENVTVTAGGLSYALPVTFVAASPSSTTSYMYASPQRQLANNSNTITASLMLFDAYSNPIPGQAASFTASGGNTTTVQGGSTSVTGLVQATYSTGVIQNENALVSAGGVTLSTPLIFTDVPSQCSLTVNPNTQNADGNNTINLIASVTNSNNQPVSAIAVVFSSSGAAQNFTSTNAITSDIGQATSKITSLYAGSNSFLAQAANVQCASQGNFLTRTPYCSGNPNYNLTTYGTGVAPYGLAVADCNNDGTLDIAVVNASSKTLSIFKGTGSGAFQTQSTYATGTAPLSVVAGDFNGDGKQDLAVTNSGSNTVSVYLQTNSGTFLRQSTYQTGVTPFGLSVGDFNSDGRQDLSIVNGGGNTVSILLGTGLGFFQSQVTYASGSGPRYVSVGDFNADGKQDLAVANYGNNTLSIFLGTGLGSFQPQVSYTTGRLPHNVAIGDFNGDGKQDLATANADSNTLGVFIGTGTGSFQSQVSYNTGSNSFYVVAGDFNGDGKQDLVVTNSNAGNIGLFLGTGSGTFQPQVTYASGTGALALAVSDLNGDGRQDIAVVNKDGNNLSVFLTSCP